MLLLRSHIVTWILYYFSINDIQPASHLRKFPQDLLYVFLSVLFIIDNLKIDL